MHNNLNKLLTNASDIRELYDDTINYIKKKAVEPEFNNIYNLTRDLVNHLLAAVKDIVELDDYKVNPGIADLKFEYDPPAHANTVNNFISNQGD